VGWQVTALGAFYESLASLGDSEETVSVAKALVVRAGLQPERGELLRGLRVRVWKSRSFGPYPALRLFYWIDGNTVYLLSIERYDDFAEGES
jgi:hypothetical protein